VPILRLNLAKDDGDTSLFPIALTQCSQSLINDFYPIAKALRSARLIARISLSGTPLRTKMFSGWSSFFAVAALKKNTDLLHI